MNEYTPTVDRVRDVFADGRAGIGEWTRFDESVKRAVEEAYAEFDRMIAEVKAQALEEAAEVVEIDMGRGFTGSDDHVATANAEAWLRARAAEIREGKS